ncbi:MAG: cell division protein SepF [Clostridia bacterium]|nr:cell division protein SepF [Clostridia bacterium]
MDRRDYNNEERDVFNNDGGRDGFIPRRRFNFSRSDYQNPENLGANVNTQSGYQQQYTQQPYSQANYQPVFQQPPYQGPIPQPQFVNQQYVQQPYGQPYAPQQPMGQMPMGQAYQYQDDGIDFDGRNNNYEPAKKKGLFSFRNKKQQQYFNGDMQNILIVTPKTLSEVQDIIDNLRNRQAIIVEFNRINQKYAQRILDFLNGAIYALGGCEQRIADNMFLFTPGGVSIQGQIK